MGKNSEYRRLEAKLYKKGNLSLEDMQSIKKNFKLEEMFSLLELASQSPKLSQRLFSDARNFQTLLMERFPFIFSGWWNEHTLEKEIASELSFLTAQVCLKTQEIRDFIQAREQFEINFMQGKYSDALEIISHLEKEYGPSYWSLDSRMSMLASDKRGESNHFYFDSQVTCDNIFFNTYMKISYYRFLREVMGSYFNVLVKEIWQIYDKETNKLSKLNSNFRVGFKVYVTSKIYLNFEYTLSDIRHLLVVSDRLTTIDKYILLERLMSWLCSSSVYNKNSIAKDLLCCAVLLWEKTGAITWLNIRVLLGDHLDITLTPRKRAVNTCLEQFCHGEKAECHKLCEEALLTNSNCFPLIDLLAKSGECSKTGRPYDELADFIRALYLKQKRDSEFTGIVFQCDGYERIYGHFTFGIQFGVIVENETRPIDVDEKIRYVSALLQSDYTPSKLAFFLSGERRSSFIQKYKGIIGSLYFCDWHIATYSETDKETMGSFCCDTTSQCLNTINSYSQNNCFDLEKVIPKNLDLIEKNTCTSFFFKKQFNLSVENNKILDAIIIYIQAFFYSQWMVNTIDYTKIQDHITRDEKKSLERSLFYCLFAYITRFELAGGEQFSETVISSCKKIIAQTKDQSPINLLNDPNRSNEKEKIYFLRNICTYDGLRRLNQGKKLAQELYEERLNIINHILPFYEENQNVEDIHALNDEKEKITSKLSQLDIARCINRGKINTSWIVFSDEADDAITSIYNLVKNTEGGNLLEAYVNAFRMVEKDYVKEINRILSIAIRHGILEAELLRFIKKEEIIADGAVEPKCVTRFMRGLYNFINSLMEDYIIAVDKPGDSRKLVLHADEAVIRCSFESLPQNLAAPEVIKKVYNNILEEELRKSLGQWGPYISRLIYTEIKLLLEDLFKNGDDSLKTKANKTIDLLEDETKKLKDWFMITENQEIRYRLATLCKALEQEWDGLKTEIQQDMSVMGSTINFLYTIIRELAWNAKKHGGDEEKKVAIQMNIYGEENHIVFKVENYISADSLETIDEHIIEIREVIQSVEKVDQTIIEKTSSSEGKSGYKKIVKLLKRKYEGRYQIDVDHKDRLFYVKISFDREALA